jgi:UDPglucose 6-dehydrogenase
MPLPAAPHPERRERYDFPHFDVVSNPEFLREGCAVPDLMNPDRVVIGSASDKATDLMKRIYEPFRAPILVTDVNSAELIKHAANSFLSLKISYINAVSAICEASGADVEMVADGIGMDKRIGRNFLNAGLGYGGSCFPKDVKAFIAISRQLGTPFTLLEEVEAINAKQLDRFIDKLRSALWVLKDKKIAVWGLTFKPDTDDVRSSVAIELVNRLAAEGAKVTAYDPKGAEKAVEWKLIDPAKIKLAKTPVEAVDGAEALVLATEWKEFANQDFAEVHRRMHTPFIFDGRNLFDPDTMKQMGFTYYGVGRARE